jgi:inosine-uridine nucleoside N-ribohydrolase
VSRRLARRRTSPGRGSRARLRRRSAGRLAAGSAVVLADRGGGGEGARLTIPVLIDCDPGHDDAIALLLALASPEVEVVGITTVHGNTSLEQTTPNALKILELADRADIPVAAGAARPLRREPFAAEYVHGKSGLDGPDLPPAQRAPVEQHAADFLAERLGPGVVLVPTGPLTNVALLLERHPDVELERIVLMGGAIGLGNVTPAAEFNIWADPEAAARVFASGIDVTMVGLDVTHKALLTPDRSERLRASGRVGEVIAELVDFYARYHRSQYGWPGPPIHDAMAVAHVMDPSLLETEHRHVAIETESELCRGRTVVDLYERAGEAPNAHVATDVDAERFLDLLESRLTSMP